MVSTPSSMSDSDTSSGHPSSPPYSVTPASRRHSDGGAGTFPTAPAMGYPSTTHKHPQSPYDVQTSALNQPPHEKNAIPNLTARGASSLPYPIKDLPSPQQLLEQQEAKWHQLFQDHAEEFVDKYCLRSLECQAELYRRFDEWYEKCEKKD